MSHGDGYAVTDLSQWFNLPIQIIPPPRGNERRGRSIAPPLVFYFTDVR